MKTEKFNPNQKPIFNLPQPNKTLIKTTEEHIIDLCDGYTVSPSDFREGLTYSVRVQYDLDDRDYYYLIGTRETEYENRNYEKQKKNYDRQKAEHDKKLKEWKILKKKWDEIQRKYKKDLEQIRLDEFECFE